MEWGFFILILWLVVWAFIFEKNDHKQIQLLKDIDNKLGELLRR